MQIQHIHLASYRNLASQTVEFDAGLNLFIGDNGQGKTNLIEAVQVLSSLRSFRAATTRELIQHGCEHARVEGLVHRQDVPIELKLLLEPGGKRLWLGSNPVPNVQDYLGKLQVVAFTPDDLAMIKGGPAVRRRFIDRATFLFSPGHLQDLRDFNNALQARNRLLRDARSAQEAVIDSFSQALAAAGHRVSASRRATVERLATPSARILSSISDHSPPMKLGFHPGWRLEGDTGTESLLAQLRAGLADDRARGYTLRGPQKDDFDVLLGGQTARRFGSQGQQRACALALLLAIVEVYVEAGHDRPVILLDDVSSELDAPSKEHLFEQVAGDGGQQVLITTTERRLVDGLNKRIDRTFTVQRGWIWPEAGGTMTGGGG